MKSPHRTTRAFTLIELLVVVAIIVAMIAILLPSLNKAVAVAQRAACTSNNRQILIGWQGYAADSYGGLFNNSGHRPDKMMWTGVLVPYVGHQPLVLICPSTDNPPGSEGVGNFGIAGVRMGSATLAWSEQRTNYEPGEPFDRASYAYNINLCPESGYGLKEDRYQSLSDIRQFAVTPVLGDGEWREGHPGMPGSIKIFPSDLNSPVSSDTAATDRVVRWVTNRHGDATNLAFADGHVEAVPLADAWSLKWHKNYDTTTPVNGAP